MNPFRLSQKQTVHLLALDIGSEFVKAVIATKEENRTLNILGVGLARQKSGNMVAGAISNIIGTVSVCEKALQAAETRAGITARKVVVGVAGELIKGKTSRITCHRKNSNRAITDQEITDIIKKAEAHAKSQAMSELAQESGNNHTDIRLINSAVISFTIDDYVINNPVGFKGSKIELQLYTAFAPLVHISAIERVCIELGLDIVAIAVEPFAACRACMNDNVSESPDAVVMDIGGGTTDIAIMINGGVEGTEMFGIGGRSFTNQIVEATGVDDLTAEKLKIIPEKLNLSANIKQRALAAIMKNLEVWLSGVELALSDFNLEALPPRILLCGGGSGLYELQELLATKNWYKDLAFSRRPLVHLLSVNDLSNIKNSTRVKLDHNFVTAIGLLHVGFDTENSAPESSSLKARLARLLRN